MEQPETIEAEKRASGSLERVVSRRSNDEWLKEQCNRYKNGQCSTRGCLKRGGYIDPWMPGASPVVDYNMATCEAHELLTELAALRESANSVYATPVRITKTPR